MTNSGYCIRLPVYEDVEPWPPAFTNTPREELFRVMCARYGNLTAEGFSDLPSWLVAAALDTLDNNIPSGDYNRWMTRYKGSKAKCVCQRCSE